MADALPPPNPLPPLYTSPLYIIPLSLYLLYMFRHFKTTFSIHHPLEPFLMNTLGKASANIAEATLQQRIGDYFRHPINTSARYGRKICPFGQHAIVALVLFLWVRWALVKWRLVLASAIRGWSIAALVIAGTCSLLNMNAVLYLLPYVVVEVGALVGWWGGGEADGEKSGEEGGRERQPPVRHPLTPSPP